MIVFVLLGLAHASDAPPWAERALYSRGDDIYAVGVATGARDRETARRLSMESALAELRSHLGTDVAVETRTLNLYESRDNGFSCYRLVVARREAPKKSDPRHAWFAVAGAIGDRWYAGTQYRANLGFGVLRAEIGNRGAQAWQGQLGLGFAYRGLSLGADLGYDGRAFAVGFLGYEHVFEFGLAVGAEVRGYRFNRESAFGGVAKLGWSF